MRRPLVVSTEDFEHEIEMKTAFETENHQLDVRDLMIRILKTKTNCFDVHDLVGKGNRAFENAGQAT
jgi:hypothetical protein